MFRFFFSKYVDMLQTTQTDFVQIQATNNLHTQQEIQNKTTMPTDN